MSDCKIGFAVGTGRCGTKFLAEAFSLIRAVRSSHERNPINETFHRYCKWNSLPVDEAGFVETKRKEIEEDLSSRKYSFEASAFLSLSVSTLLTSFPSRVVLIVRSPEKVVSSYISKGWYSEPVEVKDPSLAIGYQSNLPHFHWTLGRTVPRGEEFNRWSRMSQVGKLAWYWRVLNSEVLRQFELYDDTRVRVVRLEDLGYDKFLEISEFLGVREQVSLRSYEKLANSRPNKLPKGRNKAEWTPVELREFEENVSDLSIKLGY